MGAALIDLDELTEGDDLAHTFTFADPAGAAVNMTGYTFRGQVRPRNAMEATPLLAAFTFDLTNLATGILVAHLTKAQTLAFPRLVSWDIVAVRNTYDETWFRNPRQAVHPRVTAAA